MFNIFKCLIYDKFSFTGVVLWLVDTSCNNHKTKTTICEENNYIYRKEYLQERETVSNKNIELVIE